jgi:glycine betaine/proline transport system substrate-binding protein
MNPDLAYDCGKPRGWIKKVGWKDGEKKWPCAYKAVRKFRVDNATMGNMVGEVDLKGRPVDEVVEEWVSKNKDTWKKWTECSK